MKTKWKISILSALVSMSFLSACNVDNRNELNEQDEVDFRPVRYDPNPDNNLNESNNDYKPQEKKPFRHDQSPNQTDQRMEKGDNLELNKNRGAE